MTLSACSMAKPGIVAARVEYLTPPATLLIPCDKPKIVINTNKDLLQGFMSTKGALDRCAAKLIAVSDWSIAAKTKLPESLP